VVNGRTTAKSAKSRAVFYILMFLVAFVLLPWLLLMARPDGGGDFTADEGAAGTSSGGSAGVGSGATSQPTTVPAWIVERARQRPQPSP